ncbi:MAG: HEPN domain-containing protein [Deltaproteobacteria bacterium]|nr:MAG: HEPN domain-containing protein [Deltaproteobacteria bacterium]
MPLPKHVPGSAEDWLIRAKSDLAIAKTNLPEGALYEDLCFHAQQAAEKALKAVYQKNDWAFRYTHDIDELIAGIKREGVEVPKEVVEADVLTRFAWESRYPYIGEQVPEEEYQEAIRQAETVVSWAEQQIK